MRVFHQQLKATGGSRTGDHVPSSLPRNPFMTARSGRARRRRRRAADLALVHGDPRHESAICDTLRRVAQRSAVLRPAKE